MIKKIIKETLMGIAFAGMLFGTGVLMLTLRAYAAPVETEPEQTHEYTAIFENASAEDYEALEQVVYWESAIADCSFEVNKAVVETVCNRVLAAEWPNTIYQVCHQKRQFVCKPIPAGVSEYTMEAISDAIAETVNGGREVLPTTQYQYFATKKQTCARNHIWIGNVKANGKPRKGKGMYFAEKK